MIIFAIVVVAAVFAAASAALALSAFGVIGGGNHRSQVQRSLASIDTLRSPAKRNSKALVANDDPFRDRVLTPTWAKMLEIGQRMTPPERRTRLRTKLDLAGHPYGWNVDRVLALKTVFLIIGVAVGFFLPAFFGAWLPMLVILPLFGLIGFYTPDIAVYQAAHNRNEQIQRDLADSMDLLTVSVEAGLAFDAALQQVARNTTGPLADELARVLKEMQIGTGRADALRGLAERTNVEDVQRFVGAMVQADKLGVPISRVLRVQAAEMRVKRSQRAEEKAQKVPVKILFPLMLCIMPALFVVVIGPAVINAMHNLNL